MRPQKVDAGATSNQPHVSAFESLAPVHVVLVQSPTGSFEVEELLDDGLVCRTRTSRGLSIGTTSTVVAAACELSESDPWVQAISSALERERGWEAWGSSWGRSHGLEVKLGEGVMYHVTAIDNRSSIERWGLDWDHMGDIPGVAGSKTPEAPGIWLTESAEDHYFVGMAKHPVEMWEVSVTGVWLELRPQEWWFTSERIRPSRLRLLPPLHQTT